MSNDERQVDARREEIFRKARLSLGILTVGRLLAIAAGVISAIVLARDEFRVPLRDYLDAVATIYDDTVSAVTQTLFVPAIAVFFAELKRALGVTLQLSDHWRHIFVLLWLYFGSFARSWQTIPPRLSFSVFFWIWGWCCAMLGSVAAGSGTSDGIGVLLWPVASVVLFGAGASVYQATFHRPNSSTSWWDDFRHVRQEWVTIGLGVGSYLITLLAFETSNPPLLSLAVFVGAVAVWMAYRDLSKGRWKYGPRLRIAIDILAVMGGAAFVVWLDRALS